MEKGNKRDIWNFALHRMDKLEHQYKQIQYLLAQFRHYEEDADEDGEITLQENRREVTCNVILENHDSLLEEIKALKQKEWDLEHNNKLQMQQIDELTKALDLLTTKHETDMAALNEEMEKVSANHLLADFKAVSNERLVIQSRKEKNEYQQQLEQQSKQLRQQETAFAEYRTNTLRAERDLTAQLTDALSKCQQLEESQAHAKKAEQELRKQLQGTTEDKAALHAKLQQLQQQAQSDENRWKAQVTDLLDKYQMVEEKCCEQCHELQLLRNQLVTATTKVEHTTSQLDEQAKQWQQYHHQVEARCSHWHLVHANLHNELQGVTFQTAVHHVLRQRWKKNRTKHESQLVQSIQLLHQVLYTYT
ncbi:hypothetical protein RFI_24389 [Reticulomyxa filosa]|uniref:Uncharacterized protein n=1 Tax=Reticulomyxa filosa TaxID=46433 RepID=X6MHT8_RETFI|nr:hypothetical protein RFI_24389 [Reticulomyxa filosa]|eukprot:ETO12987.1 hypothetical protein RFI_24389 [Reticulomyxa filosa]